MKPFLESEMATHRMENILTKHISNKELMSRKYKEFL